MVDSRRNQSHLWVLEVWKLHDLLSQRSALIQLLSGDKRPIAMLLGAGCPMAVTVPGFEEPLISGISGITRSVVETVSGEHPLASVMTEVFRQCQADSGCEPTIEVILSHVRALSAVAGNEVVRGFSAAQLTELDSVICETIEVLVNKELPSQVTPYHHLARWVGAIYREKPVELFTTNYDLLMEQALDEERVPYFDGFAGGRAPSFDTMAVEEDVLPPRWAKLWKLHGSINWSQGGVGQVIRVQAGASGAKRVIYPSQSKYEESRRMPYVVLLDRLKNFLRQSDAAMVTCGYSFGDQHINEVIVEQLERTPSAAVFALMYGDVDAARGAVACARRVSNLSVLATDGAAIGGRVGPWGEVEGPRGDNESVRWVPTRETKLRAEFRLGNFSNFGRLVAEIAGQPIAS